MGHLNLLANTFIAKALANSTRKNYRSCFKQYKAFCKGHSIQHFPITEQTLFLFCTYLATRRYRPITYKSIKGYLSAIRYKGIVKGFIISFNGMNRLYYVLRGIKRHQGNRLHRPPRSPITIQHLAYLHNFIHTLPVSCQDKALYWSACTMAFFGLLRVSEYSCPKIQDFHLHYQLLLRDVSFDHNAISLFIKASKSDPFRQGCHIYIGSTHNYLCPVTALKAFLRRRNLLPGSLFTLQDGTYLTRDRLARLLKLCFRDININTHSFRIGGASALAAAGVPDAQIQIMGRWSSDCFVKYIRLSKSNIKNLANSMSIAAVGGACWTPPIINLNL